MIKLNAVKYIFLALSAAFLTLMTPAAAYAQSVDFGQDRLSDALPDNARDILESEGITPDNSGAMNLSFTNVLGELWEMIKHTAERPLVLLCSLIGVILFCALAESV